MNVPEWRTSSPWLRVFERVRSALITLIEGNPWGSGNTLFVFYSLLPEKPTEPHLLLTGLRKALAQIGIDEEERKRRNIVFHSWRHFYAARMADRVDARKLRLATGHRTAAVFDVYADHALERDLQDVATAMEEVFQNVLSPTEDAAS